MLYFLLLQKLRMSFIKNKLHIPQNKFYALYNIIFLSTFLNIFLL